MSSRSVTWTAVTWNAHGSARPPLAPAAEALRGLGADIIALQEVQRSQASAIADVLGARHVWGLGHYVPAWRWRARAEGLAIVTPHAVRLDAVEVISSARWRWTWKRRVLIEALVERDDRSGYRVVNAHLSPGRLAAERRRESRRVAARVRSAPSPAAIVAGDLNDANEPNVVDAIEAAGVRDAWRLAGIEPAWTSPAHEPNQTLDHILVPAAATDVAIDVPPGDWAAWSDHLPVRATFTHEWVQGDFV